MARPRSDDRRSAILSAAIRVVAAHGLEASTAAIAREAGISNGSLFTYFDTKAALLNQVYIELKEEMAAASYKGLCADGEPMEQMRQLWSQRLHWAFSSPEKHRVLAYLIVSNEVTPESREIGQLAMAGITQMLERTHRQGPMRATSMSFVTSVIIAVANATVDFMIQDPANADRHCAAGFDAIWRAVS
ncbi:MULTISPECIES: TetR/AcrR family transcriptional regulator [Methylobacterium]|uniref:TetR/AcrR family transcriptional regulator n=1 Tax=Methylobacterium TaxID=407 RepID=UPI0009EA2CC1|nr:MULTISPECIES: TetR/AcrR family transcriptional regulator [Methylobacterium]MCI9881960.1 TetR/AcrR family transcriptional regulator [Methylobacterium goesingense]